MPTSAKERSSKTMKARYSRHIGILTLVLFATTPSFAWGPEGHRIVATIAFRLLSQAVKDQAVAILGDEDFVDVANWADQVRLSRPDTKDWHFVDIPVT